MTIKKECRSFLPLACLVAAGFLGGMPAHAAMIIQVQNATAAPNSTGNFFDVTLTNTGLAPQNIAGFGLQLSVTDTDIAFDAAATNMATAQPYIFAGDSFDAIEGFAFASLNGSLTLLASDFSDSGTGTNVASGASFGLVRVFFSVANAAASGNFNVALAGFSATNLSDNLGGNVDFTPMDGTISISAAAVPEPSLFWPLASLLLIGYVAQRFRPKAAR